MSSVAY